MLRFLVAGLSALTVLANASAATGVPGRVLHAVPPAMFVVCFESVIITARRRALQERGAWPEPIPRQHPLRWMLAPRQTWHRWRSSVLGPASSDPDRLALGLLAPTPGIPIHSCELPSTKVPVLNDRHHLAVRALREQRTMTAQALRIALQNAGYEVSLRTAQRIRAQAAIELEEGVG